jgi:hypothetical protein
MTIRDYFIKNIPKCPKFLKNIEFILKNLIKFWDIFKTIKDFK